MPTTSSRLMWKVRSKRRLVDGLRGLDRAYRELGGAAGKLNFTAYAAAWEGVKRQEARVRAVLRSI